MAITRYEPWSLLSQLQNEMNRVLDPRTARSDDNGNVATSDWVPAVDIKEEPQRFVILADIPGVDPKDIEVHMENGILTIRGQRTTQTEEEREGFKRVERAHGTFYRRFSLPDSAESEKISAKCNHGVLEVVIPKHEKLKPRKISVEG